MPPKKHYNAAKRTSHTNAFIATKRMRFIRFIGKGRRLL